MPGLRAVVMRPVPSPDGKQADLLLTEPDGKEHQVRCLCLHGGGTEISDLDGGSRLRHLNQAYGDQMVWALCRQITLGS